MAQSLALRGYRVLAIDLDPQASLSALLGVQPELDVDTDETLYGTIRYDEARRPLGEVIRKTYFTGLDLVPANLELMEFEHETPRALNKRRAGEPLFFDRVAQAIESVEASYDVVCDRLSATTRIPHPIGALRLDGAPHHRPSPNVRRRLDESVSRNDGGST